MREQYQPYRIFLSSPGDVEKERGIARDVVDKVGEVCAEGLGVAPHIFGWEKRAPYAGSEQSIQEFINRDIERAEAFVLILHKKAGTREPGFTKTNTEREVEAALAKLAKKPSFKFLAYFRDLKKNPDPGHEEKEVRELKERIRRKNVLSARYDTPADFKDAFTHRLYEDLLRFRGSSYEKEECLRKFWQLGTPEDHVSHNTAIIYPALGVEQDYKPPYDGYWVKRLLPGIVYEDTKAIRKVKKTLQLIQGPSSGVYPTSALPAQINSMNRVWLCIPRNKEAQYYLAKYKDRTNFCFELPKKKDQSPTLKWKSKATKGRYIQIRSPLSEYLVEQRKDMNVNSRWTRRMGQVVAKDYGILARFKSSSPEMMRYGSQKDFFIAGIRGLGTWGAAHFIDRMYKRFNTLADDDDFQLLVEVTYRDGGITLVEDVSDKPKEYFESQARSQTIRRTIQHCS